MNTPHTDEEFKLAVNCLRAVIESEQEKLENFIQNYTPEFVKLPFDERMERLQKWLSFVWKEKIDNIAIIINSYGIYVEGFMKNYDEHEESFMNTLTQLFPNSKIDILDPSYDEDDNFVQFIILGKQANKYAKEKMEEIERKREEIRLRDKKEREIKEKRKRDRYNKYKAQLDKFNSSPLVESDSDTDSNNDSDDE